MKPEELGMRTFYTIHHLRIMLSPCRDYWLFTEIQTVHFHTEVRPVLHGV